MSSKNLAIVLSVVGTMFSLWIAIFETATPSVELGSVLEIAGPWLLLDVLLLCLHWYRGFAWAATGMLLLELLIYWGVFVSPKSSTDAIAYVFKPFIQVLILLPIGLIVGRLLDRRANRASTT